MRDCLNQINLWMRLWGIVLIALFDVGRSSLKLRGSLVLDPSV